MLFPDNPEYRHIARYSGVPSFHNDRIGVHFLSYVLKCETVIIAMSIYVNIVSCEPIRHRHFWHDSCRIPEYFHVKHDSFFFKRKETSAVFVVFKAFKLYTIDVTNWVHTQKLQGASTN